MSQSDLDFDDFPDEILAAIPNDALTCTNTRPSLSFEVSAGSREPTLARSQELILAPASGLSLLGQRRRAAIFSTPDPPDFDLDDNLQHMPTHVSPSGVGTMVRSQSPSTQRDGPMTWASDQVCLSQQVFDVHDQLINALRAQDKGKAVKSMKEFDDHSIRDGVDLVIAGMLQHKTLCQSLAQSLQDLILLLISDRGIKFTTNHRFAELLDKPAGKSPRKVKNLEQESPEQTVYRVWGEGYHKLLGLDPNHKLIDPLSRLAHYSEILNQHPDQLSKYLYNYASKRLGAKRPGRRDRITGKDIKALNRDLRTIVIQAHHRYTSLLAPTILPDGAVVAEANLQVFGPESDDEDENVGSGSDAEDKIVDPEATPTFENSAGSQVASAAQHHGEQGREGPKELKSTPNELEAYYSSFAISVDHRNQYISVPPSHVKFQVHREAPLKEIVDLKIFRISATVHGYTVDGSFRYDVGQKHKLAHVRIVPYYNPEHATHSQKYNGSWIVLPPFRQSLIQLRIWTELSRVACLATGLHPFHRLSTCSTTDETQAKLVRGNNIIIRNQDERRGYPWARIDLLRTLEDVGLDPDEIIAWQAYEHPDAAEVRASVPSMFAKFTTDTIKFDAPRCASFKPSCTGLRHGIMPTFGASSGLVRDYQRSFIYNPWKTADVDDAEIETWKNHICDQFPRRNGDRFGRREAETRFNQLGIVPINGSELRWTLAKGEWVLRQATQALEDMASRFVLEGFVHTAGFLESLGEAAHGACLWIKLHYGHALLFLVYEEHAPDDTVVPTEYFAGDVIALQPGQRYLLYHCQCTITTRGRFYHPSLMLSRTRFYDPREFSAPFANPVYKGSFNVMRESAGRPARGRVYPIFHQFMVTLAGLALYADSDDSCELGLDDDQRQKLAVATHIYLASPIFEYMPVLPENAFDLSAIAKDYNPAEDLVLVLRYCAMQQSFIARQIKLNIDEEDANSVGSAAPSDEQDVEMQSDHDQEIDTPRTRRKHTETQSEDDDDDDDLTKTFVSRRESLPASSALGLDYNSDDDMEGT